VRLAALLVLGLTAGAHADVASWPKRNVAVYLGASATYVGTESIGGPQIGAEYAIGHRRWQFVTEAELTWFPVDGVSPRLGGAARWLARSWRNAEAAMELFFDAGIGGEVFAASGIVTARPSARLGWGMQVNLRETFQIRLGIRATIAPRLDRDAMQTIACRGTCMPGAVDDIPLDDGFQGFFGVAW
jgi:hypothetical protein